MWIRNVVLLTALAVSPMAAATAQDKPDAKEQEKQQKEQEKLEKERKEIQQMASSTIAELEKNNPKAKALIGKSAGYGVFSTVGVTVIFGAGGGGKGLVHSKATGKDTYMRVASGGAGLGLGIKDSRVIFVFQDQKTLDNFVKNGWEAGASADAAAKPNKSDPVAENASDSFIKGIKIYQITKQGVMASATVGGSKYWKDDKLN